MFCSPNLASFKDVCPCIGRQIPTVPPGSTVERHLNQPYLMIREMTLEFRFQRRSNAETNIFKGCQIGGAEHGPL